MRLRRLDLTRYGKFTDFSIDFGERIEGQPDLHIVYGPNEAGKSTALAAFLDLLFGMEMQSRYGFLHPYQTMRVGGCLELAAGHRELVRIKRPSPTLRNKAEEPIPEAVILGDLGGLDRSAYRTMFSLDDDTLESGGNSILASNGELGQLLFSASAGVSELSNRLIDVKEAADGFTKPNARKGELHDLKSSLDALRQERRAIDTLASEHKRLCSLVDTAKANYDEALDAQAAARQRLSQVERLLISAPRLQELQRLRVELEPLDDLPQAPAGWLAELPGLKKREDDHGLAFELAENEIGRLTEALADVVVDERALQLSGSLPQFEQLRARYVTGALDLPPRRNDVIGARAKVGTILARLGRTDESEPSRLLLTTAQREALNRLILSRSGVSSKVTAATAERTHAQRDLDEAQRALGEQTPDVENASLTAVRDVLAALRQSDHAHRLRAAEKAKALNTTVLEDRLTALSPWTGSAEELRALVVPAPDSVAKWAEELRAIQTLIVERQNTAAEHGSKLLEHNADLEAIRRTAGIVNDQQAADIRERREATWAEHRRALDSESAAAFESAMRQDDIAMNARIGHAQEVAQLHEHERSLLRIIAAAELAHKQLASAVAQCQARQEVVVRSLAMISQHLLPDADVSWLSAWLDRRQLALQALDSLKQAELEIGSAEADCKLLRKRLCRALEDLEIAFDADAELNTLALAAERAIENDGQKLQLRKKVADCRRDFDRRELDMQAASREDRTWLNDWRQACSACWLGEPAAPDSETVRAMLADIADLGPALEAQTGFSRRVSDMEADQTAFLAELERLELELEISVGEVPALDRAQAVSERIEKSRRAVEERRKLQKELEEANQKRKEVARKREADSRHTNEMMAHMQAASLLELDTKLRDAARKADLDRRSADVEGEILRTLQITNVEEAQHLLEAKPRLELELEQTTLTQKLQDLENRTREYYAAHTKAADRVNAVGGDDAVARIEERRRTTLLMIEEGAQRYLRLRLGIVAAERALRAYRDEHRSSMMRQASDAFRMISRGAYHRLSTQPGDDGDILVALGADGTSKQATALSKGTRFQLYLALRAAGYYEVAKVRPPVPFIADDIMETFDDLRAEETLRVFGEMATKGQVIYLTHHDHLREMAERTVPGVRVHRLPG